MHFCLCEYITHECAGACEGQKRALDALELELQAFVNCPKCMREPNTI